MSEELREEETSLVVILCHLWISEQTECSILLRESQKQDAPELYASIFDPARSLL